MPHPVKIDVGRRGAGDRRGYSIFPGDNDYPEEISWLLEGTWRKTRGHLRKVYREDLGTGPVENAHADWFLAQGKTMSYVCHDSLAVPHPGGPAQGGQRDAVLRARAT